MITQDLARDMHQFILRLKRHMEPLESGSPFFKEAEVLIRRFQEEELTVDLTRNIGNECVGCITRRTDPVYSRDGIVSHEVVQPDRAKGVPYDERTR
jgi:hypothetical protein